MSTPTERPDAARSRPVVVALVLLGLATFGGVLRDAWVCDDAYITMRTVDNFVEGYGLRWNVDERVQVYTHPLWMLGLTATYAVLGDPYATTLALALTCTAAFLALLVGALGLRRRRAAGVLVALVAMLSSKAFVDWSTSGLENPATHLLLLAFVLLGTRGEPGPRRLLALTTVVALAATNRMDSVLLFAPCLALEALATLRAAGWAATLRATLVGLAPFLAWLAFATFYYGFPFPNPAYAKLDTGVDAGAYLAQGLDYLRTLDQDPTTALVLVAAVVAGATTAGLRPLALGVLLYVLYTLRVGGDFMLGRFFAAPFVLGTLVLALWPGWTRGRAAAAAVAFFAVGLTSALSPLRTGADYGADKRIFYENGVTDERAFYFRASGLFRSDHRLTPTDNPWTRKGLTQREVAEREGRRRAFVGDAVGAHGLAAGPEVIVVDKYALTDPFLARMPIADLETWRPGHFERALPEGYLETRDAGENVLADPTLAARYDRLRVLVADDLLSPARLRALLRL